MHFESDFNRQEMYKLEESFRMRFKEDKCRYDDEDYDDNDRECEKNRKRDCCNNNRDDDERYEKRRKKKCCCRIKCCCW